MNAWDSEIVHSFAGPSSCIEAVLGAYQVGTMVHSSVRCARYVCVRVVISQAYAHLLLGPGMSESLTGQFVASDEQSKRLDYIHSLNMQTEALFSLKREWHSVSIIHGSRLAKRCAIFPLAFGKSVFPLTQCPL